MADHDLHISTSAMGNIATGTSVITGALAFLNDNAGAISVLIAFASFIVALIFYILNYRMKSKANEHYLDEVIEEVISRILEEAEKSELNQNDVKEITAKVKAK